MSDYTEDSVIIQGDGVIKGLDGVRAMFQAATSSPVFKSLEIKHRVIEGNFAYIVWSVPGMIPFGTDTFVVEDGKIRLQTVALHTG